jgi:hypothetical protein
METIVEKKEYREELLEWCNNIIVSWESMKPRFSKRFDEKSLEEWEDSCRNLMNKLQTNDEANTEDYEEATRLFDQWELLYKELNSDLENEEAEERNSESISVSSDIEIDIDVDVDIETETEKTVSVKGILEGLTVERIELIKMVLDLETPMDQIRKYCLETNE